MGEIMYCEQPGARRAQLRLKPQILVLVLLKQSKSRLLLYLRSRELCVRKVFMVSILLKMKLKRSVFSFARVLFRVILIFSFNPSIARFLSIENTLLSWETYLVSTEFARISPIA